MAHDHGNIVHVLTAVRDAVSEENDPMRTCEEAAGKSRFRGGGGLLVHGSRSSCGRNCAGYRRETPKLCGPGVSTNLCRTPLLVSHSSSFRLSAMRRSSVPQ